jgi:hypothetical protein
VFELQAGGEAQVVAQRDLVLREQVGPMQVHGARQEAEGGAVLHAVVAPAVAAAPDQRWLAQFRARAAAAGRGVEMLDEGQRLVAFGMVPVHLQVAVEPPSKVWFTRPSRLAPRTWMSACLLVQLPSTTSPCTVTLRAASPQSARKPACSRCQPVSSVGAVLGSQVVVGLAYLPYTR